MGTEAVEQQLEEVIQSLSSQSLYKLLSGVIVLIVGVLLTRLVLRMMGSITERLRINNPALHTMLHRLLKWMMYFISIMAALGTMGIPINSLVALFSVIGLALSLAVQGVLTNLAGGIILFTSKPFVVGDFVEADDVSGTIREVSFLYTIMESADGKLVYLPNSLMNSSRIINYNTQGKRRIDLTVSVSYDNAPEEVRHAVQDAILTMDNREGENEESGVMKDPEPQVLLESYGESAIEYTIRLWVKSKDYARVRYALNEELYRAFRHHGVVISYPHIMVHTLQEKG